MGGWRCQPDTEVDWARAKLRPKGMGGWKVVCKGGVGVLPQVQEVSGSWTGSSPPSSLPSWL